MQSAVSGIKSSVAEVNQEILTKFYGTNCQPHEAKLMQNNKTVELNIVRDALFSDQTKSYLREENRGGTNHNPMTSRYMRVAR